MKEQLFDKNIFRRALEALLAGRELEHPEIVDQVEGWMDSGKTGLILMGSVGTGKTTIAYALRRAWMDYLTIARVKKCDKIADLIKQDETWKFEVADYAGLLVLDDFGTENKVWNEESIPFIIYRRVERNLPTIITTNYNTEKIRERYGERIADRLRTYSRIVMNYESLRR